MKRVDIWTDGSCLFNPGGAGGWAAILIYDGHRREISGGVAATTNNRMELRAAVEALKVLKEPCEVRLITDSTYVCLARRKKFKMRANKDLWEQLRSVRLLHQVEFLQTRGHGGDPENERADVLAGLAARGFQLPEDPGYERKPPRLSWLPDCPHYTEQPA